MSWSKFSDDFSDDCWTLSDAAFRLHVEGLVWNSRKLLDLRIPKDELRRFAKHPEAAPELVAVGWWTDEGAFYVIRHHGSYQRTREQVLAQQAASAENGKKGGRPRKGSGVPRERAETQSLTQWVSAGVSDPVSDRNESPGPSRAEPRSENPVANPVANPVVNPQGQDRTGQVQGSIAAAEVNDEEAAEALRDYRVGRVRGVA